MALGTMQIQVNVSQRVNHSFQTQTHLNRWVPPCEVGVSAPTISSGDLLQKVIEALSSCKTGWASTAFQAPLTVLMRYSSTAKFKESRNLYIRLKNVVYRVLNACTESQDS